MVGSKLVAELEDAVGNPIDCDCDEMPKVNLDHRYLAPSPAPPEGPVPTWSGTSDCGNGEKAFTITLRCINMVNLYTGYQGAGESLVADVTLTDVDGTPTVYTDLPVNCDKSREKFSIELDVSSFCGVNGKLVLKPVDDRPCTGVFIGPGNVPVGACMSETLHTCHECDSDRTPAIGAFGSPYYYCYPKGRCTESTIKYAPGHHTWAGETELCCGLKGILYFNAYAYIAADFVRGAMVNTTYVGECEGETVGPQGLTFPITDVNTTNGGFFYWAEAQALFTGPANSSIGCCHSPCEELWLSDPLFYSQYKNRATMLISSSPLGLDGFSGKTAPRLFLELRTADCDDTPETYRITMLPNGHGYSGGVTNCLGKLITADLDFGDCLPFPEFVPPPPDSGGPGGPVLTEICRISLRLGGCCAGTVTLPGYGANRGEIFTRYDVAHAFPLRFDANGFTCECNDCGDIWTGMQIASVVVDDAPYLALYPAQGEPDVSCVE